MPLEAVKEAIAYCESNPPELQDDYVREQRIADAVGENDPNYRLRGNPKSLSA